MKVFSVECAAFKASGRHCINFEAQEGEGWSPSRVDLPLWSCPAYVMQGSSESSTYLLLFYLLSQHRDCETISMCI